jgi:hypothetical protein
LIPTWQGKIKQNVVIVNCGECTNDDMKWFHVKLE